MGGGVGGTWQLDAAVEGCCDSKAILCSASQTLLTVDVAGKTAHVPFPWNRHEGWGFKTVK